MRRIQRYFSIYRCRCAFFLSYFFNRGGIHFVHLPRATNISPLCGDYLSSDHTIFNCQNEVRRSQLSHFQIAKSTSSFLHLFNSRPRFLYRISEGSICGAYNDTISIVLCRCALLKSFIIYPGLRSLRSLTRGYLSVS